MTVGTAGSSSGITGVGFLQKHDVTSIEKFAGKGVLGLGLSIIVGIVSPSIPSR